MNCSPRKYGIKQQLGFEAWSSPVYCHSVDSDKSKREKMLLIKTLQPYKLKDRKKNNMEEAEQEQEARGLKSVAEAKCKDSNFKSALKYAKRAERLCPNLDGISSMVTAFKILRTASKTPDPNWYKILQVEPFAHTNTIKKNYKKLAFLLHPDKNPHAGSEEAFKLVSEAFRFLSDKLKRKEYDMRLRIRIQDEKIKEGGVGGLGSSVVVERETFWTSCSTCRLFHQFERRKSFKALEVESDENGGGENVKVRTSERLRNATDLASKGKIISNEGLGRRVSDSGEINGGSGGRGKSVSGGNGGEPFGWRLRRRMSSVGEVMERSKPKKAKTSEDMMTLAEMQSEMKKKAQEEKMKMKLKLQDKKDGREKEDKRERLRHNDLKKGKNFEVERRTISKKIKDLGSDKTRCLAVDRSSRVSKSGDLEIMAVEDSDFYDFDKDREERSFKKGQVWAIYDDDDGMPRHYGLIDEVVSVNPFEGSVWALYNEAALDAGGSNLSVKDKRCYDIVVFLTTYSEMHGLSMGYLEKVDGFKTVFKRREIGSHAIRWLEKNDVRLVSHQIPARKLSGDEAPNLLKDCWELDPASLPPDLLTFVNSNSSMAMAASSDSVSSPKARTWCDHLVFFTSDLTGIPSSDTPCKRCSVIPQFRAVYETAYILKFGEAPSFRKILISVVGLPLLFLHMAASWLGLGPTTILDNKCIGISPEFLPGLTKK
ncbi:DNAJ heat shock N-terminal domain-containing protein [Prunus dulcis]|uniref:DNAJ heat shock N-terminal domain-containing protein n=1 Tax=Prunus dulcis TaxID=3755 RepID=A0A4Y1S0C4_PRUDU|nr:DNAJ heat shock N-terminal domain-containing protein [Prunus dulcis]